MPGARYRVLVYLTLLASFLVVVWGGVVRVTGSGLGCPDWPLCHGQFLPGLDPATQIEWFHRFLGIAGGLTLASLVAVTLARYRSDRRLTVLVVVAGLLYVLQAVLGAIVVLLELPDTWVTVHLANAELVLAVLTVLAVGVRWPRTFAARERGGAWTSLLIAATVGTYILLLTGAYVRGASATTLRCRSSARPPSTWRIAWWRRSWASSSSSRAGTPGATAARPRGSDRSPSPRRWCSPRRSRSGRAPR